MRNITISKKDFKILIKESVKEVLEQEMMRLRALMLPYVSEAEQKDIERRYKKPIHRAVRRTSFNI
jgi:DNA invertase Pin-like site-specific DNA recombinase